MPIPKPEAGEDQAAFMARCMKVASGEFPHDQAAAICMKQWGDEKISANMTEDEAQLELLKIRNHVRGLDDGTEQLYSPSQPRDEHGMWTKTTGGNSDTTRSSLLAGVIGVNTGKLTDADLDQIEREVRGVVKGKNREKAVEAIVEVAKRHGLHKNNHGLMKTYTEMTLRGDFDRKAALDASGAIKSFEQLRFGQDGGKQGKNPDGTFASTHGGGGGGSTKDAKNWVKVARKSHRVGDFVRIAPGQPRAGNVVQIVGTSRHGTYHSVVDVNHPGQEDIIHESHLLVHKDDLRTRHMRGLGSGTVTRAFTRRHQDRRRARLSMHTAGHAAYLEQLDRNSGKTQGHDPNTGEFVGGGGGGAGRWSRIGRPDAHQWVSVHPKSHRVGDWVRIAPGQPHEGNIVQISGQSRNRRFHGVIDPHHPERGDVIHSSGLLVHKEDLKWRHFPKGARGVISRRLPSKGRSISSGMRYAYKKYGPPPKPGRPTTNIYTGNQGGITVESGQDNDGDEGRSQGPLLPARPAKARGIRARSRLRAALRARRHARANAGGFDVRGGGSNLSAE